MLKITTKGNFNNTSNFFKRMCTPFYRNTLDKYGKLGVDALSSATPTDSGQTASSWSYKIDQHTNGLGLSWYNSNVQDGACIAILIQYGHGTRNGGYVQGVDYINPALKSVFENMANELWEEVRK